ncbi:DUF2970 domain-containing protein [Algicola sagamiensis]|uniref:DUF2970 domain-containing protein n=1 Tax=Algicola sagamiensis TaxID=163869 RepID=UPI00035DD384|nr:DUF2970 domain-containing protein [Algicola sagamiensis]
MSVKTVPKKTRFNLLMIVQSVFAAAFGVQSNRRREEDFQQSFWPYAVAGILFLIIFLVSLMGIVQLVLL